MFDTTACDLRSAAHTERVAHIELTGWQQITAVAARPRLEWMRTLIVRVGRLAGPTRRAGRVATSPAGRGLA
jgi:hypothetical protein